MKIFERVLWVCLGCAVLVFVNEFIRVDATEVSFSPDTLEVRSRKVRSRLSGVSLWPRGYTKRESPVLQLLVDNDYVQPIPTDEPRWIALGLFSQQWRDGQGQLMYVFQWRQEAIIEWCQADPARARLLWSTVFPLLRSQDPREVQAGEAIAHWGVREMSIGELQKFIDDTLADCRVAKTTH